MLSTYKYYYNSQSDSKAFPIYLNYKKENKALSLLDRIFFQKGLCFPTEERIRQNWTKLDKIGLEKSDICLHKNLRDGLEWL